MNGCYYVYYDQKYLSHAGIKGQKWGIRRYQNPDGSLTEEGKARYGEQRGWEARQMYKRGTISRDEMKQRRRLTGINGGGTKADKAMAVADFALSGNTRRTREFRQRHKTGFNVASAILAGVGGGLISGTRTFAQTGNIGAAVVSGLVKGTIKGAAGLGLSHLSGKANDQLLKTAYNNDWSGVQNTYNKAKSKVTG